VRGHFVDFGRGVRVASYGYDGSVRSGFNDFEGLGQGALGRGGRRSCVTPGGYGRLVLVSPEPAAYAQPGGISQGFRGQCATVARSARRVEGTARASTHSTCVEHPRTRATGRRPARQSTGRTLGRGSFVAIAIVAGAEHASAKEVRERATGRVTEGSPRLECRWVDRRGVIVESSCPALASGGRG